MLSEFADSGFDSVERSLMRIGVIPGLGGKSAYHRRGPRR